MMEDRGEKQKPERERERERERESALLTFKLEKGIMS